MYQCLSNGSQPNTPTALGANVTGAHLEVSAANPTTGEEMYLTEFRTPEGLGIPFVPLPIPQVHIGLVKGTELMVRFLPQVHVKYDTEKYTT
jgi:hypothetical protein